MLLAYLAAAAVAGGQPVHEVEEDITRVAHVLGYRDVQVAAAPTGVTLSLGRGTPATYEKVDGGLRLDQSAEVNAIRTGLVDGSLSADAALDRLLVLRARPHRFPRTGMLVGGLLSAAGIATVLQPSWAAIAFAVVCNPLVMVLVRLSSRRKLLMTLLPSVAAFLVSAAAFWAFEHGLIDGPLRTLLAPLAVLLPGALIVTGLAELAAGAMVAGTARLAYGGAQLMLFAMGVAGAALLLDAPTEALTNVRVSELSWWGPVIGLPLIVVGISLMESVSRSLAPWILLVVLLTFGAQVAGQALTPSPWAGAFLGAVAASAGAILVETIKPSLPRIAVFLPSFWMLVPGSLGLVSITQLGLEPQLAVPTITTVMITIAAIALGVLVGATVGRSARLMIRQARGATARLRAR